MKPQLLNVTNWFGRVMKLNSNNVKILKKHIWQDKIWNILFLVVGAVIGFGANYVDRHYQRIEDRTSLLVIYEADIEYHVDLIKTLVTGFKNFKEGMFPDIAKGSSTLDRSMEGSHSEIGLTVPTHHSSIFDSTLSRIHLLPKDLLPDIIRFYANLEDCDAKRSACQAELENRKGQQIINPDPLCDIYLEVMESTLKRGRLLLHKLQKSKS